MAQELKTIPQEYNWNSFSGWEWDGFYYWPKGSYRLGANLETRKLENGVMVANKQTVDHTYLGTIKGVSDYYDRLYSTMNWTTWKIYYAGAFKFNMAVGVVAHDTILGWGHMKRTAGTVVQWYGISAFNTTCKVHRFDVWFTGVTYSVASFTPTTEFAGTIYSRGSIPTLSLPEGIKWAFGNIIYSMDVSEVVTASLTLQTSADIIGITVYQNQYRIYWNDGNIGNVSSWDGSTNAVQQTVSYFNSPIVSVVSDWPYDWAVFGSSSITSDIYRMAGLERQSVRNNIEFSDWNSRYFSSAIGIKEWIVYIAGQNKNLASCMYSYGSYYPGVNRSLVPENLTVWDATISRFSFWEQYIYTYYGNNVYKRSVLFKWEIDTTVGSITSFPCIGNIGIDTEKELTKIYVAYKLYNASDTIKIYARTNADPFDTNSSPAFVLLKTITGSITARQEKITDLQIRTAGIGKWNQIEFRIDITNASTNSAIFYGLRAFYTDNPWE
jgi:hypothetical protein